MPYTLLLAAAILVMVAPAADAGGKRNAAKADARTVPYTPSELDAKLAAWDADDVNPFATDAYRVRTGSCGLQSVDQLLTDTARLEAIVAGTRFIIDQIGEGNADAIAAAPTLVPLLMEVPELGQGLIARGQAIPNTLPGEVSGPDKLEVPKCLPMAADAVTSLETVVERAPKVAHRLSSTLEDVAAAGK
jgi:hypothetical protein